MVCLIRLVIFLWFSFSGIEVRLCSLILVYFLIICDSGRMNRCDG